jgi:hypothetical protein
MTRTIKSSANVSQWFTVMNRSRAIPTAISVTETRISLTENRGIIPAYQVAEEGGEDAGRLTN